MLFGYYLLQTWVLYACFFLGIYLSIASTHPKILLIHLALLCLSLVRVPKLQEFFCGNHGIWYTQYVVVEMYFILDVVGYASDKTPIYAEFIYGSNMSVHLPQTQIPVFPLLAGLTYLSYDIIYKNTENMKSKWCKWVFFLSWTLWAGCLDYVLQFSDNTDCFYAWTWYFFSKPWVSLFLFPSHEFQDIQYVSWNVPCIRSDMI